MELCSCGVECLLFSNPWGGGGGAIPDDGSDEECAGRKLDPHDPFGLAPP